MAAGRSCVCLLVVLVYLQVAVSKPMFDWLFCDMLCTDDDITATNEASSPPFDLFSFDCSECPTEATTAKPAQSISVNLPSIPNGMRMNVTDNNGVLQFVLDAVAQMTGGGGGGAAGGPAGGAAGGTAAAAPAPAGNATGAAPANATAAG